MNWTELPFKDFVTLQRGFDLPKARMAGGDVPVLGSNCVLGYHNERKVEAPGVVTGRSGTLGVVQYAEHPFWPHNTALWVKDFKGNDPKFVYYKLQTLHLERFNGGVSVPTLNRNVLDTLPIRVPQQAEQARLAAILSAYDDLLKNNRRRIQLLEQAARLLYKEWFVCLRFPGHEHVKIKNGVPEGWEKASISSFCVVGRGGSPRPIKDYLDGNTPWFKIGDATLSEGPFILSTHERITDDGVRKSVLLPPQELILSNSATCGIPYFTGFSGCIHDGWLYFKKLQRVSKWLLYCGLFAKQQEILAGIGEGATQKNLNTNYVGRQALLLPKEELLLSMFDNIAVPLFTQIFFLARHNLQLTQARDLLLPRLMSGEVAT